MKRIIGLTVFIALLLPVSLTAQRYITRNGSISFFSKTPMENIEAHNNQVNVALDFANGSLAFRVLIKSFNFEKALMQQHFNENYMESDKYPTAVFNGKIKGFEKIDLKKNGTYQVEVTGDLTIHGVKKRVTVNGTIEIKDGIVKGTSEFTIRLKDYKVKRPKAVSEVITISVSFDATKI